MATAELFRVWELILVSGFNPEIHDEDFCADPV